MTDLIAWIGAGTGTIAHVEKVISGESWDKVYVLTTHEFSKDVPKGENIEMILIDKKKMLSDMVSEITEKLKGRIKIMETAVNIISGEGKEHMALLSALLKLGCGIRLVALTKEGVMEV